MSSLLKPQIILKGLSIRPCRQVLCSNVSTSTSGLFGAAQAAGSGAEDQSRFLAALEKYSIYQPTPVSIQHFIKFAQNSCAESSFAFLKHELPVRLANIMKELQLLPKQLHETHACKVSKNTYEKLMIIQVFYSLFNLGMYCNFWPSIASYFILYHFWELWKIPLRFLIRCRENWVNEKST